MSRRPTRRETGLPAAAALAGGITSAHRDTKPLNYDHPRLPTEREATRERERLELEEWTALREVRLRAEILLDTAPESPVFCERRDRMRAALERAVFEADRLTDHLRRPTVEGVVGPCPHPGAGGPCLARLADGRCVWCERALA